MNVEEVIKTKKEIPIESRTIIHLTLVYNKINDLITQALKPFDVSIQQFNVLRILRGQNGQAANLSTLNERMVTKMSNTTRLVDKLLLKGHVKRNVCQENRRKVEIFITEQGLMELKKMDHVVSGIQMELLEDFSKEDLKELNQLLHKF